MDCDHWGAAPLLQLLLQVVVKASSGTVHHYYFINQMCYAQLAGSEVGCHRCIQIQVKGGFCSSKKN